MTLAALTLAVAALAEPYEGRVSGPIVNRGERLPANWGWRDPPSPPGGAPRVSLTPDGRRLAVGGPDDHVRLLDLVAGSVTLLGPFPAPVAAVACSPDGRLLAFCGGPSSVWVCSAADGSDLRRLELDGGSPRALAWSPDSQTLAVGGRGGVWLLEPRDPRGTLRLTVDRFTPLDQPSGGEPSADEAARRPDPLHAVTSVAWSRDGHWLAAGCEVSGAYFHLPTGLSHLVPRPVVGVAFSPDDRWLLLAHPHGLSRLELATFEVSELRLAEPSTPALDALTSPTAAPERPERVPRPLAFSPDGQLLVFGGTGLGCRPGDVPGTTAAPRAAGPVRVQRASGLPAGLAARFRPPPGPLTRVESLAWSSDGRELAVGCERGVVLLGRSQEFFCRNDCWLWTRGPGTCLRGGPAVGFVLRGASGEPREWLPPRPARPVVVTASLLSAGTVRALDTAPVLAKVRLAVANTGPVTAYDVHLGLDVPPAASRVPAWERPGFMAATRVSLEPGGVTTLTATFSFGHSTPPVDLSKTLAVSVADVFGAVVTVPLTVDFTAPRVELDPRVEVTPGSALFGEASRVALTLRNSGRAATGPLRLDLAALPPGTTYSLEPATDWTSRRQFLDHQLWQTPQLPPLAPGQAAVVTSRLVSRSGFVTGRFELVVEVSDATTPFRRWRLAATGLEASSPRPLPWNLVPWALVAPLLLWFGLVARHPFVRRAGADPAFLASVPLVRLKAANRWLRWSGRLDYVLSVARLDRARWAWITTALDSPRSMLAAFCRTTASRVETVAVRSGPGWVVEVTLPAMRASLDRHAHLVGVLCARDVKRALASIPHGSGRPEAHGRILPVLLAEPGGDLLETVWEPTPLGRPVLLDEPRLRAVLLDPEPVSRLLKELAARVPPKDLSPYKTQGAVMDSLGFFGRRRELETLSTGQAPNVLLYGPRGIGKSSLLKAVERRFLEDLQYEPRYVQLGSRDLQSPIREWLCGRGLPGEGGIRDLLGQPSSSGRVPYWLIDEADLMVEADAAADFQLLRELRALREEGRARFILAGYWELYQIAEMTHSPIKNFAETMRLGPLDREPALEFVTRPVRDLGLAYETPGVADEILRYTAHRPDLIGWVCNLMLQALGPRERRLTNRHLEEALRDDTLGLKVSKWRALSRDAGADPAESRRDLLDRTLFYQVLVAERPASAGELASAIRRAGAAVGLQHVTTSLDRLRFAFLIKDEGRGYEVAVPLVERILKRRSPRAVAGELIGQLRQTLADTASQPPETP